MKKTRLLLIPLLLVSTGCNKKEKEEEYVDTFVFNQVSKKQVEFGKYPQSEADLDYYEDLGKLAGETPVVGDNKGWNTYDYYVESKKAIIGFYKDIVYKGDKYRGVYFFDCRPGNTSAELNTWSPIHENQLWEYHIYWYKFEPILWDIIKINEDSYMISSNVILDSHQFDIQLDPIEENGSIIYPDNYKESDIRKFINEDFYNLAFNDIQKSFIKTTNVDNSLASTKPEDYVYSDGTVDPDFSAPNPFTCENTKDNIFLLSRQEVCDSSNSFALKESVWEYDYKRAKQASDYSLSQGLAVYETRENAYATEEFTTGSYWLRSPQNLFLNDEGNRSTCVDSWGGFTSTGTTDTYLGVLPALNLSKDILNYKA